MQELVVRGSSVAFPAQVELEHAIDAGPIDAPDDQDGDPGLSVLGHGFTAKADAEQEMLDSFQYS
eukprot:8726058-Lingulodinium_polyedra.AAC.1